MVTGKNKEQFEEYVTNQYFWDEEFLFSDYPFEMQIGVYLAYYDSIKIDIDVDKDDIDEHSFGVYFHLQTYDIQGIEGCDFNTRNEAYKEAFKKANDLING